MASLQAEEILLYGLSGLFGKRSFDLLVCTAKIELEIAEPRHQRAVLASQLSRRRNWRLPHFVDLLQALDEARVVQFDFVRLEVEGNENAVVRFVFEWIFFEQIFANRAVNKAGLTYITDPILFCYPAVSNNLVFVLRQEH